MCRLIAIIHDTRLPFIPIFAIPLWTRVKGSRRDWAFRLRRHALHSPSWCRRNFIIRKLITWRLPSSLQGFYLYLYIGSMIFLLFMYATMFWGSSAPITSKSFAHTAFDALALSCENSFSKVCLLIDLRRKMVAGMTFFMSTRAFYENASRKRKFHGWRYKKKSLPN